MQPNFGLGLGKDVGTVFLRRLFAFLQDGLKGGKDGNLDISPRLAGGQAKAIALEVDGGALCHFSSLKSRGKIHKNRHKHSTYAFCDLKILQITG